VCIDETRQKDLFFQVSKFGVREFRERIAALNTDDLLSLDYKKAGIVEIHAIPCDRVEKYSFEDSRISATHSVAGPCGEKGQQERFR